ncbi:MAG: SMP-30/gluconolactonase/LRE family protein [Flavobacteriaceae bacterium]
MRPEVVCTHICELGEGPIWDLSNQLICWLDIINGEIHEWSPNDRSLNTISVGQMIGSMAISTDGNFVAALENGFGIVNRHTDEIKSVANPEEHKSKNRFNDGKCDPAGRFWAGTMSLSEESEKGSLYMLNANGEVSKKIEKTTISNGLAWSLDHKAFYFIDTSTFKVSAYDYDKSTGALSNKRTIINISKGDGYPDGMTIDNEGMLWIAHWDGWQVTRWDPATGKKLAAIALPVSRITSCTFGGKSFEDLYITSAKVGLSKEELEEQPLAGSLFVIRNCGYKGLPAFQFNSNIHK